MKVTNVLVIRATIEEVFAFFDDPAKTLVVNPHAEGCEIVVHHPDGRRTYDIPMRAGEKRWMQTVEQVLREPPTRLVTRGGTWDHDRTHWLLTVTTERRFERHVEGTRVEVATDARLDDPLRGPLHAFRNWLTRDATKREYDRQLWEIAALIEAQQRD